MQNNLLETNTNNWRHVVCSRKHQRLTSKQQDVPITGLLYRPVRYTYIPAAGVLCQLSKKGAY